MAEFSASDAAYAGFRFIRDHPKVIAVWFALRLLEMLAVGLPMVAAIGPAVMKIEAMKAQGAHDPAATAALLHQIAPALLLMVPVMLVVYAVFFAAMNRAALRPDDSRFAYLRLGGDEARQGLLFLWVAAIAIGFYIAAIVTMAFSIMLGVSLGFLLGASSKAAAVSGGMITAGIVAAAFLLVAVFLKVRVSLASPLTFDRGKMTLFGSWPLTRGRFWRLFGTYLLVMLFCVMLALIFFMLSAGVAFLFGGLEGIRAMMRPDMSSLAAYLSPERVILIALDGVFNTVVLPVIFMPAVTIYRHLQQQAVPS